MGASAPSARDRQPERLFDQPRARFPHAIQPDGTAPAAHIAFCANFENRKPLRLLGWLFAARRTYRSVSEMLDAGVETRVGNERSGTGPAC